MPAPYTYFTYPIYSPITSTTVAELEITHLVSFMRGNEPATVSYVTCLYDGLVMFESLVKGELASEADYRVWIQELSSGHVIREEKREQAGMRWNRIFPG